MEIGDRVRVVENPAYPMSGRVGTISMIGELGAAPDEYVEVDFPGVPKPPQCFAVEDLEVVS